MSSHQCFHSVEDVPPPLEPDFQATMILASDIMSTGQTFIILGIPGPGRSRKVVNLPSTYITRQGNAGSDGV